jgi:hypothetical protein
MSVFLDSLEVHLTFGRAHRCPTPGDVGGPLGDEATDPVAREGEEQRRDDGHNGALTRDQDSLRTRALIGGRRFELALAADPSPFDPFGRGDRGR